MMRWLTLRRDLTPQMSMNKLLKSGNQLLEQMKIALLCTKVKQSFGVSHGECRWMSLDYSVCLFL